MQVLSVMQCCLALCRNYQSFSVLWHCTGNCCSYWRQQSRPHLTAGLRSHFGYCEHIIHEAAKIGDHCRGRRCLSVFPSGYLSLSSSGYLSLMSFSYFAVSSSGYFSLSFSYLPVLSFGYISLSSSGYLSLSLFSYLPVSSSGYLFGFL